MRFLGVTESAFLMLPLRAHSELSMLSVSGVRAGSFE